MFFYQGLKEIINIMNDWFLFEMIKPRITSEMTHKNDMIFVAMIGNNRRGPHIWGWEFVKRWERKWQFMSLIAITRVQLNLYIVEDDIGRLWWEIKWLKTWEDGCSRWWCHWSTKTLREKKVMTSFKSDDVCSHS